MKPHEVKWTQEKIGDFWRVYESLPYMREHFYPPKFYEEILWESSSFLKDNQTILDVGCGTATLLKQLVGKGRKCYGIDLSKGNVNRLNRELKAQGLSFKQGSIWSIPFPDESFDVVFATEVIEHLLLEDLKRGLIEVKRVLKKGGTFIISTPYKEKVAKVVCPDCMAVFAPYQHLNSFDEENMGHLLVWGGLSPVVLKPIAIFYGVPKWGVRLVRPFLSFLKLYSWCFFIVARKK